MNCEINRLVNDLCDRHTGKVSKNDERWLSGFFFGVVFLLFLQAMTTFAYFEVIR